MRRSSPWVIATFALVFICAACSSQPEVANAPGGSAASGSGGTATSTTTVRTAMLAEGRAIKVRTTSTLSTKTNKSGEEFTAVLDEAIKEGDWVIADRGATVTGRISNSDPGGRVKGVASMTLTLVSLTTGDGQTVDLTTSSYTAQAKTTKKKDAAKVGIGAGAGAVIGAIAGGGKGAAIGAAAGGAAGGGVVMATRGDPAVIPAEAAISFTLRSPVTITQKK